MLSSIVESGGCAEQKPTNIDFTIENNGTLGELHDALDGLVDKLEMKEDA